MIEFKTEVHDQEVTEMLGQLRARTQHLKPAMQTIGAILVTSVKTNFEVGGRYEAAGSWRGGSQRWQPLAIATLFAGKKSGIVGKRGKYKKGFERTLTNRKILIKQSLLIGGIHFNATDSEVSVGPDRSPYAAIQNFGGMAGRGKKVKIPARPYLVVQDEDWVEIKHAVTDYLLDLKGG